MLDSAMKRVIWEAVVQYDTKVKLSKCQIDLLEEERPDQLFTTADRYEPMPELIETTIDNEKVLRSLDEYATKPLLWLSSYQARFQDVQ
jgi:hypothetical protein